MIVLIPVPKVDDVWPYLAAGFHESVMKTGGDITVGDIWQGCRRGDNFLLVAYDNDTLQGASVWSPRIWQTGSRLWCLGLFGERMEDWIEDMHQAVIRIAKDCGATALASEGRIGWKPIFPNAKRLRVLYEEPI